MKNVEPMLIEENPGAPIACDMTTARDTPEERLAEYGRLFAHALVDRRRTAEAVELVFAAKPGVAEWVTDLARREAACCPFCTYEVTADSDGIVWRTSSHAGAAAQIILDELHALPERIGEGVAGLLDRLGKRGVSVVSPEPGRFTIGRLKSGCGC